MLADFIDFEDTQVLEDKGYLEFMAEHLRRRARLRRAEGAPQDEVDDAAANFAVELGQVVGLRLWSLVRT
eukprot:4865381-Prorocentrum_lima.AAC.1